MIRDYDQNIMIVSIRPVLLFVHNSHAVFPKKEFVVIFSQWNGFAGFDSGGVVLGLVLTHNTDGLIKMECFTFIWRTAVPQHAI